MRCRLGLDDTDHVDEGCTTSSFDELLSEIQEAMNCDIIERRLVRLWPFAERRTRGNGALGAIIDIPDKDEVLLEKICNDWFDRLLTKVAGYPPSKIPAAPCLVISFDKAPEHWYWDAVRGYVNPENILREAGNTGTILLLKNEISGVVGACAAISWESNPHSSWELIAWRDDSSLGSERRVSPRSVSQLESLFPGTFLNRDPTKGKGLIAPRTPCPVLYGIRGSSSSEVGRDRYIEWVGWMANVATSIEKILQEVRNLQRTEIGEVAEEFDAKKQVGSSTMAHKKNPITAENACGLARVVRSMIIPSYENALLWHERDLANSSSERFTLSHSMILLDDVISKCDKVLSGLVVNRDRMRKNIEDQNGLIMAEKIMLELVDRGMPRDRAHEELRSASMQAV